MEKVFSGDHSISSPKFWVFCKKVFNCDLKLLMGREKSVMVRIFRILFHNIDALHTKLKLNLDRIINVYFRAEILKEHYNGYGVLNLKIL